MIQAGSFIGGFLSGPMQASDPSTIGYTVGFSVAAAGMTTAAVIFAIIYRRVYSPSLETLNIGKSMSAFFAAIGSKITCKSVSPDAIDFGREEAARVEREALEAGKNRGSSESECLERLYKDEANWMMKRVGPKFGAKSAADAFQISRIVPMWICLLATCLTYDVSQGVVVLQGQQMLSPGNSDFYSSTFQQSICDPLICLFYMTLMYVFPSSLPNPLCPFFGSRF